MSIDKWRGIAEERIRQAQEEGAFDNLPGAGQPLPPDAESPHAAEWKLAFRLLDNADMAPRWIELDKEIRRERVRLRAELLRAHRNWPLGSPSRERAIARLRREAQRLNARTKLRNYLAPRTVRPRFLLDIEREILKASKAATA